jgi:hypothetical protein
MREIGWAQRLISVILVNQGAEIKRNNGLRPAQANIKTPSQPITAGHGGMY